MENHELRITNCELCFAKILCVLCVLCGSVFSLRAQSTNQMYPTPITVNEIGGKIPARDLGDARLTSYFYVFNGSQGDIFLNVKTSNLDGDIDIFAAENLRPLTKITVFSDASENETGRVIYLRKPEKLILRIQGRTPNDEPATFSLKFAGSFAPAPAAAENAAPELPEVKTENQGVVRVNSVGTIIEIKPKPTPKPKEIAAENEPKANKTEDNKVEDNKTVETAESKDAKNSENPENNPANDATAETTTDAATRETKTEPKTESKRPIRNRRKPVSDATAAKNPNSKIRNAAKTAKSNETATKPPNPLENVHLIILFKDGTKIERVMSEVLRFGVNRGVLTLITKDGSIGHFSILDVAKMTIE